MKTIVIPGRFQPLHDGHIAMIEKALGETPSVVVDVRDTRVDKDNPFTYEERAGMIRKVFGDRVKIRRLPDPDCELEIWAGRKVGWAYREIQLPAVENISGTKLREEMRARGAL